MSILNSKSGITQIPTYLDGRFEIFEITQDEEAFSTEYIRSIGKKMSFEFKSISDRLRYEFEQRDSKITLKIRIPQTKEITSKNVLKVGDDYHKVFNAYHFVNKDGFKQTDLTLEEYNPKFEVKS